MKKAVLLLGLIAVIAFACKKSDDSPVYKQEQLYGTWETIETDEYGCVVQLIITEEEMDEKTICPESSISIPYESYSFDGRKISVTAMGMNAEYVINELTETKLVVTIKAFGMSNKKEYKKVPSGK
jgi:hypothetical protein